MRAEVLGITSGASKIEIKKAYHKAALAHHPDKAAEDDRAEAEVRFKAAKQAYEILSDDQKRSLYDTHGMSAFDPASGAGGPGMDDIFAQMFGSMGGMGGMGGFGGMPGMGGMPGGMNVPRKGRSVEQEYEVSLEELYKGKTTKFSNTKNVVCSVCKGSGGKQGAKSHACGVCNGRGRHLDNDRFHHINLNRSKIYPSPSRSWPCLARDGSMWQLPRIWPSHA